MTESKLTSSIRRLMEEISTDAVEERVIEYVMREVRNGRKLSDVLDDPYVKNRLSEEKVAHVLEDPEVVAVIEEQITEAFRTHDFGFSD